MHDEISNVLLKCHFCMEHRTQTVQFKIADSCGRSFAMGASAAATSLQRNAVVDGSYVCDGCNAEYRVEIIVREGVFYSVSHSR
jgi:hypothetical protein